MHIHAFLVRYRLYCNTVHAIIMDRQNCQNAQKSRIVSLQIGSQLLISEWSIEQDD